MLYMVELHYDEEHRAAALNYFWEHGATHYEGRVVLKGVWVATQERIAYALIEGKESEEVEKACAPLSAFGTVETRHVMTGDQI